MLRFTTISGAFSQYEKMPSNDRFLHQGEARFPQRFEDSNINAVNDQARVFLNIFL